MPITAAAVSGPTLLQEKVICNLDSFSPTHHHRSQMSTEAHTVHIGTLTSGVTVGQLAVRKVHPVLVYERILVLIARPAWLDDAHLDRQSGSLRASLRDYQGRYRQPPTWSQDVLEQRCVGRMGFVPGARGLEGAIDGDCPVLQENSMQMTTVRRTLTSSPLSSRSIPITRPRRFYL
jgi:hypothetical protein